jgi:hypothetical protein
MLKVRFSCYDAIDRGRVIEAENYRLLSRMGAIQARESPYGLTSVAYHPPSQKKRMVESRRVDSENSVSTIWCHGTSIAVLIGYAP